MAVQFYVNKRFMPGFEEKVRLLYACKAGQHQTSLPTVLHSHEDRLELVYIYQGQGIHNIRNRFYHTRQGNLLVYNRGIVHDECAHPDVGMCVYNCAVTGLSLPDLPENCLIADDISPVLSCSPHEEAIEGLALYMSPSYLSHLFKQETGFAPIQYIMRRRIGKAQSLLISTDYSVTKIASMIGCDSSNYFNYIFKKTVGMPPPEIQAVLYWRQQCQNQIKKTTAHVS